MTRTLWRIWLAASATWLALVIAYIWYVPYHVAALLERMCSWPGATCVRTTPDYWDLSQYAWPLKMVAVYGLAPAVIALAVIMLVRKLVTTVQRNHKPI
jgi:hypothetical protein